MWRLVQVTVRRAAGVRVPVRSLGARPGGPDRTCTVDPHREEDFLFPDLSDDGPAQEKDLVQHQPPHHQPPQLPPQQQVSAVKQLRTLERQLQVLGSMRPQESNPDSFIQFEDADFPLDPGLVASHRKRKLKRGEHKIFGTADAEEEVSDTCCPGCGAVLHCSAASVPGFLPSEKFRALRREQRLGGATCQRCYLLTHHRKALDLQLSRDQYRAVVRQIRPLKALVLLVVDLLDVPDSIVPDLPRLVGANKHVVVLGNKVDLLPCDAPNYLQRIKRQLHRYCRDAGFGEQVSDVHLISAKTGFGIEGLVTGLQRAWKYKGDVYLVGSANAGKSTLFNALLESDYCKTRGPDVIHRATISPWPGTTLNLLKFPIINPTPYRMFRRQQRLDAAAQQTQDEMPPEELKRLQQLSRHGYLVGRVGSTFRSDSAPRRDQFEFDMDSLSFGENEDGDSRTTAPSSPAEFTYNELKDAHWLFDTPGIMKERDLLPLLTEQEVRSVVPTHAIVPRTFILKPGSTLFLGALARIDYVQGQQSCWFSVLASAQVPVHVTSSERAGAVYERHAGDVLLGVPLGGSERMKAFPALRPQEVTLEGRGHLEAAADITLSSAGWVAVTGALGDQLLLRVSGPEAAGFSVRTPPLLPHVVSLKGRRVHKSAAYKPLRTAGRLQDALKMMSSPRGPAAPDALSPRGPAAPGRERRRKMNHK